MTKDQIAVLQDLAAEGYAVVVFTPEELQGTDPDKLEDVMTSYGWEVIEMSQVARDRIDKKHQELEQHEAYGVQLDRSLDYAAHVWRSFGRVRSPSFWIIDARLPIVGVTNIGNEDLVFYTSCESGVFLF